MFAISYFRFATPSVSQILLAGLILSALVSVQSLAQTRGSRARGNEIALTLREFDKVIYRDVVEQHLLTHRPIAPEDVKIIRSLDTYEDAGRIVGQMTAEQKATYYLTEAILKFYEGESADRVLYEARRAYNADKDHPDANDGLIFLSLYYGEYDQAREILKENQAGRDVLLTGEVWDEWVAQRNERLQPLSGDAESAADPNGTEQTQLADAQRISEQESDVEGDSRWAQLRRRELRSSNTASEVARTNRSRRATASRTQFGVTDRDGRKQRRNRGLIGLPLAQMPHAFLGKNIRKLKLLNLNDTWTFYDPLQKNVLCIYAWMVPAENAPRSSHSSASQSYLGNYRTPGATAATAVPASFPVQQVKSGTFDNLNQLRGWYRHYRLMGGVQFMGINLDPASDAGLEEVGNLLVEYPWPWANAMNDIDTNRGQLPLEGNLGAGLLIADPSGTVVYTGPVGGFLPRLLFDKYHTEQNGTLMARVPVPDMPGSEPAAQIRSGTGAQPQIVLQTAPTPPEQPRQNQASGRTGTVKRQSDPTNQAIKLADQQKITRLMDMARIQRRVSVRNALGYYDEIIEKWPQAPEAQRAKIEIQSICRQNPGIAEERESMGKYTGS